MRDVKPGDKVTCSAVLASPGMLDAFTMPEGEWYVHDVPEPKYGPVAWASLKDSPTGIVTAMWPAKFCRVVESS